MELKHKLSKEEKQKKKKENIEKGHFLIRVDINFNKEILSILDEKSAALKLTRSKYIRNLIEEDKNKSINVLSNKSKILSKEDKIELNRIGNNLNQNTTFANSNKLISSKLEKTLEELEIFMNKFS